jgi:hypothetical protein
MKRLLPFFLGLGLGACGSSGSGDAGPPITAQGYYGFVAGQCFEYSETDGGLPTLGIVVASEATGVALQLDRHGQETRVDHLVFDGGLALLTQQDFVAGGTLRTRNFATPIEYVQAPLATTNPTLSTSTGYQDNPSGSGQESWETDVLSEQPFSCAAGSYPTAFELQFTTTDSQVDGGESFAERRWAAPDVGFVDVYTQDDLGMFANFSLVDVKPADGGCAAH